MSVRQSTTQQVHALSLHQQRQREQSDHHHPGVAQQSLVSPSNNNQAGKKQQRMACQQVSPSAIVDSPDDNLAIKQPNSSSINSFNAAIQQRGEKSHRNTTGSTSLAVNPETTAPQTLRQIHRKSPTGLPFKVSSSLVGPGPPNEKSQKATMNGQSSKNIVGSSIAKKHLHYFKHSAVTSLDYAGATAPVSNEIPKPTTFHKQSQSINQMPLPRSQIQQLLSRNSGVSRQSTEGLKTALSETLHSNQLTHGQQFLQPSQTGGESQAAAVSVERLIPIQKVRIAKKVPQSAKNKDLPPQQKSLSLKLANLNSTREKTQIVFDSSKNGPSRQLQHLAQSNTETQPEHQLPNAVSFQPKKDRTDEEKESLKGSKRLTRQSDEASCLLSPQTSQAITKEQIRAQHQSFLQKKMSTISSLTALNALSSKQKNQKSTKILRKHVNFDIQRSPEIKDSSKPMNNLQRHIKSQPSALISESGQRLIKKSQSFAQGTQLSLMCQLQKVNASTALAHPTERLQSSQAVASQASQNETEKDGNDEKDPPTVSNQVTNAAKLLKKKAGPPSLEIQIPQSPDQNPPPASAESEAKETGRKQTEQIKQAIRTLEIPASEVTTAKGRSNQGTQQQAVAKSQSIAMLKVTMMTSSSSNGGLATSSQSNNMQASTLGGHQPLQRSQQHPSTVLESIQAIQQQSAITPIQEKSLQVYRPNCQSTRNLPASSSQLLQGCVPSTASVQKQHEQAKSGEDDVPQNDHSIRGRPPAPKTAKHQQSRSQSGMRQANSKSGRTDSIHQKQQQQSPLAQYANYAFQPACKILLPKPLTYEPSKTSIRRNGVVRGYAANTHQGLIRNYNEDRVSIILNISEPDTRKKMDAASGENSPWPICSFFGIYDGHGGCQCADFLRDNLHQYVTREPCFPDDPREAIKIGFAKAEKIWIENHATKTDESTGLKTIVDRSGSCAIVIIIIEEMCYVANVGDSRAVLSGDAGTRIFALSRDHKPCDEHENKRIHDAGGRTYSRQLPSSTKNQLPPNGESAESNNVQSQHVVQGPLRIFPGRLSVSRAFGDVEAKLIEFGGNPQVLIATPEIKAFRIKPDHDFILLGCDGIFDRINNREATGVVWNATKDLERLYPETKTVHQLSGLGVDYLVKNSLLRRSLDNVTAVLVAFRNLKHTVFGDDGEALRQANNGSHHPNTTKAVPQVSMNAGRELPDKGDPRSNSQALRHNTTNAKPRLHNGGANLTKEALLSQRINSCRALGGGGGGGTTFNQLNRNNYEETDASVNGAGGDRVKLGNRLDSLVNKGVSDQTPTSKRELGGEFQKTLTRQDGANMINQEEAAPKVSGSHGFLVPIKSSSMTSSSQRITSSKIVESNYQDQPGLFSQKGLYKGVQALQPQQQKSFTQEAKIPQYLSRDGLSQKLNARRNLQKSTPETAAQQENQQKGGKQKNGNGRTTSSDVSHSFNLSVTPGPSALGTDNKITALQAQTRKKQTMPRFFKFGEGSDPGDASPL